MQPIQPTIAHSPITVDLFCRVIDNYGDAGVCLRLARALVLHHGFTVRLWCDDVPLLNHLEPRPAHGLGFHDWADHVTATPAQGVICGFGCTLDDAYLQAMAARTPQPAYIHLEYLSAEPWVETTHGLWSTHPRLGLKQRFCNPGFSANTAGLLHEAPALPESQALHTLLQYGTVPLKSQRVFVFAYPCAAFDHLIAAAQQLAHAVHWVLPQGAAGQALYLALEGRAGHTFTRLPFVSQRQFDAALRSCHTAWVRGEDSAVTAMFAGIPMLWQLYPQNDGAHWVKMQAYIDAVASAMQSNAGIGAWVRAMQACNGSDTIGAGETQETLMQFLNVSSQQSPQQKTQQKTQQEQQGQQQNSQQSRAHRWAEHCNRHVPDLAVTASRWLSEWKIP